MLIGQKTEQKELKQIYYDAISNLPHLLTTKTDDYYFGAEVFRAWAADIENGKFDELNPEEINWWFMYHVYVCNLATNDSCCHEFLKRAQELNPDDNGKDLEALGGGFNVTLDTL